MYDKHINDPKALDTAGRVLPSILGVSLKERDKLHTAYLISKITDEDNYTLGSQLFAELCYHTDRIDLLSSKTNDHICLTYLHSKPALVATIKDIIKQLPTALQLNEDTLLDTLLLITHTPRMPLVQALMKIGHSINKPMEEVDLYQCAAEALKRSTGYTTTEYDDGVVLTGAYVYPNEILIKLKYATKVYISPTSLEYGDNFEFFTSKNKAKPSKKDQYYMYYSHDQVYKVDKLSASLPLHIPSHDKQGVPLTTIQQQIIAAQVAQLRAFSKYYDEGYLAPQRDSTGRMHDMSAIKLARYALKSNQTCYISAQEQAELNVLLS